MSGSASSGRKHEAAKCENCTLYDKTYVPNKIVEGAIAVVGEAPGRVEVKTKVPFSGPSGQLLEEGLEQAGLSTKVSKLNVVGCQPPGNRTPTGDEIACCEPRLFEDLYKAQPSQIVTLGNTATQTVLATKVGISKMRTGLPKEIRLFESSGDPDLCRDIPVVPTFHPAACMRVPAYFPLFLFDMKKLRSDLRRDWYEPEYTVVDTEEEAIEILFDLACLTPRPLAMDIETGINKDEMGHPERYQWLCVGLCWEEGKVVVVGEEALKSGKVRAVLENALATHQLICHNGKFDLSGLQWKHLRLWFDTMIASYVLDEQQGTHRLEYLAEELLGAPSWKHALTPYLDKDKNYASIPRDVLYLYNAKDLHATFLLFQYFAAAMSERQRELHDNLTQRVSSMLQHCEEKGSRIDVRYLEDIWKEQKVKLETMEEDLKPWVDNPRSWQQVKAALWKLNCRVQSTNEKVLDVARRTANTEAQKFIDELLEYRGEQKLESTYMRGIHNLLWDGRIHPNYLIHGTTTGRLSCKKPNIMNQPRGPFIRRMYVPDTPNHVWVQADYKTAELRVVAVEANDSYLIEVLTDNSRDIHGEVSDQYYGPGQWGKEERVRAKAVVYGLSYGREADSIAKEYNISKQEAERLIGGFFDLIPATVEWRNKIWDRVIKEGWDPETHFGRKRRFHLITKQNVHDVQKQTYAFIPQSTSNDICLLAACDLHDLGVDVRILVHDSILAQAKANQAEEVGALMAKVMQEAAVKYYTDVVPFYVDVEIGTNWGMT
jgi:uracil-DNA glycosylase family 4